MCNCRICVYDVQRIIYMKRFWTRYLLIALLVTVGSFFLMADLGDAVEEVDNRRDSEDMDLLRVSEYQDSLLSSRGIVQLVYRFSYPISLSTFFIKLSVAIIPIDERRSEVRDPICARV